MMISYASRGILSIAVYLMFSCTNSPKMPYQDVRYTSKVFQRDKYYRLYLPKSYNGSSDRFPVMYFFHGWGGRYKSDDNANLAYEKLQELVEKYNSILVMCDGNMDESEGRPYNIGNHEDVKYDIQMKDYFIELVQHIDSTYRTLADRQHRGAIGFSMGGFMSYYLAGKYPDVISAAVSMTGSPEFFVGYPGNHTLYPLRYTFQNLKEVQLRFHNSTADELTALNSEVNKGAHWEGGLSYEYWQFVGGHVVDKRGETEVFERAMKFVAHAFESPLPPARQWSHYDIYPDFQLYGYEVNSSKEQPGFINLSRVSKRGFGLSTLKWLPDGPPVDSGYVEITTAPIYADLPGLNIVRYDKAKEITTKLNVMPDREGRLKLRADMGAYEYGVYQDADAPEPVCINYALDHQRKYLRVNEKNELTLSFFNRGGSLSDIGKLQIALTCSDSSIKIEGTDIKFIPSSDVRVFKTSPIRIVTNKIPPGDGSPPWVKVRIKISGEKFDTDDAVTLPVLFEAPESTSITVDDGVAANDSTKVFGKGNADGVVNPGENVLLYSMGHRLRLYTDDPFIVSKEETLVDEVVPAVWPDGFTLSSLIKVDRECPDGHVIECLASYETKDFMPINRHVHWTRIKFTVKTMRNDL